MNNTETPVRAPIGTEKHFRYMLLVTFLTVSFWSVYQIMTTTRPYNYVLFITDKLNMGYLPQLPRIYDLFIPLLILLLLAWQKISKKRIIEPEYLGISYFCSVAAAIFGAAVYFASMYLLETSSSTVLGVSIIAVLIPLIIGIIFAIFHNGLTKIIPFSEIMGQSLGLMFLWTLVLGLAYGLIILGIYLILLIAYFIIVMSIRAISAITKWLKAEEKEPEKVEKIYSASDEAFTSSDVIRHAYTRDLQSSEIPHHTSGKF